jgi:glycerol-3-phosphate acyltransferase PlsY
MSHPFLIAIAVGYLLGSIPFGYILMLVFKKQDVRAAGSGNIGATNVARTGGKYLGIATLLLDLGKAFTGVALAQHLIAPGNYEVAAAAAIAAICGHVFPIWLGFRGGKGVASALGVFLALTWPSALCVLGVFIGILLLTRYVSLASILAAAAFPLFAFHFVPQHGRLATLCFLFVPALIIVKHHANIRRLVSGTENRFGSKKVAA